MADKGDEIAIDAQLIMKNDEDDMLKEKLVRARQNEIDGEIANLFPMVASQPLDIAQLYQEYTDEIYRNKLKDLQTKYSSVRKTRPDGNCFYRAFIFAYLESLFNNPTEAAAFEEVIVETRKGLATLGFPDFTLDDFYEAFHGVVKKVTSGEIKTSADLLENLEAEFDSTVVYLRILCSYYLQKEAVFFSNFIVNYPEVADFCKVEVEPMNKESDHIHIIALSSVLKAPIRVVYMDRGGEDGKVNEHDFSDMINEQQAVKPKVHLLYRPGHYDILYPK